MTPERFALGVIRELVCAAEHADDYPEIVSARTKRLCIQQARTIAENPADFPAMVNSVCFLLEHDRLRELRQAAHYPTTDAELAALLRNLETVSGVRRRGW